MSDPRDFESNGHEWTFIQDAHAITHWCRRCGTFREDCHVLREPSLGFRVPGMGMAIQTVEPSCRTTVVRHVIGQIENIEQAPGMWGSPLAIELQYVQLLEILMLVRDPGSDSRLVRDLWIRHVHVTHPEAGPSPLADVVPLHVLITELRALWNLVQDQLAGSPHQETDG